MIHIVGILQESNSGSANKTPDRENMNPDLVAFAVKNSNNKYQNPKYSTGDKMTPCKHHVATPPMTGHREMKTLLTQKI